MCCLYHGGGTGKEKFTENRATKITIYTSDLPCGWRCSLIDVGISCHEAGYLSSSEIYRRGQWVTARPLPVAVAGVRGVTLDNTVFMTGQLTIYSENTN